MDNKSLLGIERERELSKERYEVDGYFSETQWASYLFIIKFIIRNVPKRNIILEIGVGGGYVTAILRELGYSVVTYDVNKNLNPKKIIDISEDYIPEEDIGKFGCVICAEVLEHIPFSKFEICLNNLYKLTNKYVIITLPDNKKKYQLKISIGDKVFRSRILYSYFRRNLIDCHYWELNFKKDFSYKHVQNIIKKFFDINEEGEIINNIYHHYYLLKKR